MKLSSRLISVPVAKYMARCLHGSTTRQYYMPINRNNSGLLVKESFFRLRFSSNSLTSCCIYTSAGSVIRQNGTLNVKQKRTIYRNKWIGMNCETLMLRIEIDEPGSCYKLGYGEMILRGCAENVQKPVNGVAAVII